MQNNFDIKLDVEKMSLEELKKAYLTLNELTYKVKSQLTMRKMAAHKYPSSQKTPTI